MKLSKDAQKLISKTQSNQIKDNLNSGGRNGAKKDFFTVLKRSSKPVAS